MISWLNGQKYENLLQFNTTWLASVRMWYILDFDLTSVVLAMTLIKKRHTLNFYSLLHKFLLKTKTYELGVGNCGSLIYC